MSLQAFADPTAGSFAKYIYSTQSKSGSISRGTQVDSVVSFNQNGSYQLKTEITLAGQVNQTALWNLSGNYFSNTEFFINHCEQIGGKTESLSIAAGTYSVCHVLFQQPDDHTISQEIWLSTLVPLFIVKQIRTSTEATQITLELEQFESKGL